MVKITCTSCNQVMKIQEGQNINPSCSVCGVVPIRVDTVGNSVAIKIKCGGCGKIRVAKSGLNDDYVCREPRCKAPLVMSFMSSDKDVIAHDIKEPAKKSKKELQSIIYDVSNVSVIVLCHNLIQHTRECIDHIVKNNVTEIILVDNGSKDTTREWAESQKNIKYIRNQINLGCAIGRNQGAKHATKDFLFFIDNDQFIPHDLLESMLSMEKDVIGIELWQIEKKDFIAVPVKDGKITYRSYVGSGGLLIRKEIFEDVKGYDERYAPAWYEDSDLCFRLTDRGYKFACYNNHGVKHLCNRTVRNQDDYDPDEAKNNSRLVFEETWSAWMRGQRGKEAMSNPERSIKKPSVTIVCDVKGWAWDFKAQELKKYLSDEFDINIFYRGQRLDIMGSDILFTFECDNVGPFVNHPKFITGVTAHVYPAFNGWQPALRSAKAIHANSKLLFDEIKIENENCYYLPNGVDHELFRYEERLLHTDFTAGYVGKNTNRKGYQEYIHEACKKADVKLKAQVCRYSDLHKKSRVEMSVFYRDIDLVLVASDMDGTPNQLLEAASVGRTFIANKIGNVPEFYNGENGYIVSRDVDEYVKMLKFFKENRQVCKTMGIEARKEIEINWTWKIQAENYRKMFREVLNND